MNHLCKLSHTHKTVVQNSDLKSHCTICGIFPSFSIRKKINIYLQLLSQMCWNCRWIPSSIAELEGKATQMNGTDDDALDIGEMTNNSNAYTHTRTRFHVVPVERLDRNCLLFVIDNFVRYQTSRSSDPSICVSPRRCCRRPSRQSCALLAATRNDTIRLVVHRPDGLPMSAITLAQTMKWPAI